MAGKPQADAKALEFLQPEMRVGTDPDYRDRLAHGKSRGRGANINPGNRFEDLRLHILGETLDEVITENPDGVQVRTQIIADHSKTLINHVDSEDIGFSWTINPYRGCEHGCIYCYARPTHEYLGMSSGLDFETKIMAKLDAAELLRRELASPKWQPEPIVISGVTDPYQPIEKKLRITRGIIEVLHECRQPFSLITKSHLITRDIDLLSDMAKDNLVSAAVSITTLDPHLARLMEPRASTPRDRLAAVKALSDAGIPTSVMTAPIIPGLNDEEIPALLKAAADHGAGNAGWVMLRLPYQIKDIFIEWLARLFPDRAKRIVHHITDMRNGMLYESTWKVRGRGRGQYAEQIKKTHRLFCEKYGLTKKSRDLDCTKFRRPNLDGQMGLFA
jgi:DNA repair photolyase